MKIDIQQSLLEDKKAELSGKRSRMDKIKFAGQDNRVVLASLDKRAKLSGSDTVCFYTPRRP